MQKLQVSVVIPVKNEEKNIQRLLESIKNQSYSPIEVLVVDDGSTDATVPLAKKFIKHVYSRDHAERSVQRNFGAKESKGNYLLFLDGDMELSPNVVHACVQAVKNSDAKMVTIAEITVGNSWIAKVRKFEREMYMGEPDYEVPRFFERSAFFEFGGYDTKLTGPEDYDLPFRMRKKYKAVRVNDYIYHHEEGLTLSRLLNKKFYYAGKGALYAQKHPELVKIQGTIIFRSVYLKKWRKFVQNPFLGLSFLFVRTLETIWAVSGFINKVGIIKFIKTSVNLLK